MSKFIARVTVGCTAAALLVLLPCASAQADVTAVQGSAYGYFSNVSMFGGPFQTRGPTPSVTLPPGGGGPNTASAPTGLAQYGPAVVFSSGPLTVSTQGLLGPAGSVTSSTNIATVNTSLTEVFTATNVASMATASQAGVSGSTTITGGTLQISETGGPGGTPVVVVIPVNPAPNTTYDGVIESAGGDAFRYIFNEQIVNPDGSLTVNAAHQYFLGPTVVGELFIGQSVAGVTVIPEPAGMAFVLTSGILLRRRRR